MTLLRPWHRSGLQGTNAPKVLDSRIAVGCHRALPATGACTPWPAARAAGRRCVQAWRSGACRPG